ncbi:4-phosphoerythronate dehydrogenase, partial [Candidatus Poribacteria bacterium]|nr:4-phosphoerythronate dehydrogenase [Candidatus Poribacteria bacterium]
MRIVADENIPQAAEALAAFGDVRLLPGRAIRRLDVHDADALLVRSVTRVNEELLSGSRVQFVGTATIGTDHVDLDYLRAAGIEFASAQGSNADSVVEYVIAAILVLACRHGFALRDKTLGIIGHGNIGSRLARLAPALGLRVLVNDPPLQRAR